MSKINQRRISNIDRYIPVTQRGSIVVSIDLHGREQKAMQIGFSKELGNGEQILPGIIGPVTRKNSEGSWIMRKDKPKETLYRQAMWHWKQWSGQGNVEEHSKIVDIPYQRFPRDLIAPHQTELKLSKGKIISTVLSLATERKQILHTINLYLEIFGECEILSDNLEPLINVPTRVLHWQILPRGIMPWASFKETFEESLKKAGPQKALVFHDRFELFQTYQPDFCAIGTGGFNGYVIFGFKNRNLFISESIWYGNAIYIFKENWEKLSQMTKADILQHELQEQRIVHYADWKKKVQDLLTM